ncbi:MAG: radical SAM protein [Candidatus Sumerlaeota bacterium]|nr:radical SAM protein [Candidatus Sumerlaeota bacterium]
MLKVLLINPPALSGARYMKEIGRCGRRAVAGELWPQTGLAYLAAMAEQGGHEARIIDGMASDGGIAAVEREATEWQPDVIVAATSTPTFKNDVAVIGRLRELTNALIAWTGTHVSALPEESLRDSHADLVIINEAEETLAELLTVVEREGVARVREHPDETLAEAPGLAWRATTVAVPSSEFRVPSSFPGVPSSEFRVPSSPPGVPSSEGQGARAEEQSVIRNSQSAIAKRESSIVNRQSSISYSHSRLPTNDLDSYPLPARRLLPNQAYRMPFFSDGPFATVIPTRGCPWPCTFCRAGGVWGRKVRTRAVENVIAELRQINQELGIRNIVFMTDSFTLNRAWAMQLCNAIRDEGLRIKWIANSRVDAVDLELLRAMKQAGCLMVSYGIESGDPAILKATRKGITLEQSRQAIALTRQAGLKSMAYFILGLPGETWETVRRSIAFAKDINPDYVNFHVATPFPGTELYGQALERGWLTTDDWDAYEEEGSAVMQADELSPEELMRAQRMAMRAFYLRPWRLVKELFSIRSLGDLTARLKAGWNIIATLGK